MMKKWFSIFILCICMLSLSSCTKNDTDNTQPGQTVTVQDQDITLDFSFGQMEGTYSGEMVDGLPNGIGKFTTKNAEGLNWYYEGSFKDGHFNGEGKNVWDSGQMQEGVFINDIWNPNPYQFFKFIESLPSTNFTITEKAREMLETNPSFFPTDSPDALAEYTDPALTHSIHSDIDAYGDKLMHLSDLTVTKVDNFAIAENPEGDSRLRCTYLTLIDGDQNFYELYYEGDINSLKVGDILTTVYALPIGAGTFHVVENNPTPTLVLGSSYIYINQ